MTNSTRCALLAKQACTTLSHVVQKITPPSANNFLKLFFALFAMLALNVGNAWGAEYQLVKSSTDLVAGCHYVIGATYDGTTYFMATTSNTNNRKLTSATVTNEKVTLTNDIMTFTLGGSNNAWTFKTDNYAGTAGYLNATSTTTSNHLKIVANDDQYNKFTISVDANGVATITCNGKTSRHIMYLNGTTCFACYDNKTQAGYVKPSLYKEVTSEPPTPAKTYDVTWMVNGEEWAISEDVEENTQITTLPTEPTDECAGKEFQGWTDKEITDGEKPAILFKDKSPAITKEGTTFYAVFAKKEAGEGNVFDGTTGGTFKIYAQVGEDKKYLAGTGSKITPVEEAEATEYTFTKIKDGIFSIKTEDTYITYVSSTNLGTSNDAYEWKINAGTKGSWRIESNTTSGRGIVYRAGTTNQFGGYATSNVSENGTEYYDVEIGAESATSYSDYTTNCNSEIEFVELGDDFKWSAAEAEVTIDATDNVFPTLTNTHNVPVTYSSTDDAIASIVADGTVTLNKEGTVTITAKYEGGVSAGTDKEYKAKTVTYSLKVNKAAPVASGVTYVKVTSTEGITNGEYLIVYEEGKVAFNGALNTLDAVSNTIEVEITDGKIAGTNYIDDAVFTIDATEKTIKSASGKYIGRTAYDNGLDSKTEVLTNTITISEGNAVITASGNCVLRYNKTSGQDRFRYFKSGQEPIALYKKASSHTVTIATCTNGSVSADVASGATVLSGTTITLTPNAETGYKLAAYDVYKTGDATTKVTVTDGKFIMPEHDVTISATFELAKTLTGIEITNAATQTTFWQTETFNHDDLKVTAHFDGAADEDVTDKVTVTGSTETAGAAVEVTVSFTEGSTTKTITYTINVKAIPNTQETAYTVAEAYDIIDKLTTAEGVFIKGIVSQVDEYLSNYKSITYWISDDGTITKQLQAYSGKGLEGADFVDINGVSVEDQVIVCGDLKKHTDGTYEFNYNNYLVSQIKTTKADPELSYTTTEYNVNLGDAFTAPTLNNPHTLDVTYSSNNEDVATVAANGAVTIKAAGTVTITASFAGDDDYVAGSASYTINITDPNVNSVTFDATIDKTADAETLSLTKDVITMTFTSGAMNNGENYRCYKNQTLTISATDASIQKIEFECTSSNPISGFADATGLDKTNSVWIGNAKSVELTASNNQVRMSKVNVYYKKDKRANAELAWSEETVSLTVGDAFTAPTFSNPNSVTGITFTSDNEDLATVNAGVISLVSGKTGTATITATYAGNETYKPAEVTCVITVNPKTETVVILAQYNGQWYALKNVEETAGKVLAALPVNYVGGKLYNVEEADKATIEWQRAAVTDGIIFKNGENYISGTAGDTDLKLYTTECVWTLDGSTYKIGNRTFIYRAQANGFKNYNATTTPGTDDYSNLPVVTAPVYGTGTITPMENLTPQMYGTICLENNVVGYEGITFYKVAGKEGYKVIFDEVTELVAGMPYIYIADSETATIVKGDKTAATPGKHNSLQGTFIQIDPAVDNILVGNYMLVNNVIKKCGKNCGLKANRAYFVATELENNLGAAPQPMPGRRRVTMGVTGENEATGVDNITENGVIAPKKLIENGQLIIIRDGVKYNVQGQKL